MLKGINGEVGTHMSHHTRLQKAASHSMYECQMLYRCYILSSFLENLNSPGTRTYSDPKLMRMMRPILSRIGNRSFQKVGIGRARTRMSVIRLVIVNASVLAARSVQLADGAHVDSQ